MDKKFTNYDPEDLTSLLKICSQLPVGSYAENSFAVIKRLSVTDFKIEVRNPFEDTDEEESGLFD